MYTPPVVVLTCDPDLVRNFWPYAYAPLVLDTEARRHPPIGAVTEALGGRADVMTVPIPADCADGFNEAYYARPEMLLDPAARRSCSAWSFVDARTADGSTEHLRRDLADGTWDARYGALRWTARWSSSARCETPQDGGVIAQRIARVSPCPAQRTPVASVTGRYGSRSGTRAHTGSSATAFAASTA